MWRRMTGMGELGAMTAMVDGNDDADDIADGGGE